MGWLKNTSIRILACLAVLAPSLPSHATELGWLVQVESTFKDEATQKDIRTRGTGFIGRANGRYFVFCDSHLSQGKDLKIRTLDGKAIAFQPANRLADNDSDIELVEIPPPDPQQPVFEYCKECEGHFILSSKKEPSWKTRSGGGWLNWFSKKKYAEVADGVFVPVPQWLKKDALSFHESTDQKTAGLEFSTFGNHDGVAATRGHTRLGRPPDCELAPNICDALNKGDYRAIANDKEWVARSKIIPGMSGAPAIQERKSPYDPEYPWNGHYLSRKPHDDDGTIEIVGMGKSYHRYFARSSFSTADEIKGVLEKYQSGLRGKTSPTEWKFKRFSYRDYGDGTQEILPLESLAGTGDGSDGGTGDGSDGGNSGTPSNIHSGNAALGVRAGMLWHGKPVLAFRVEDPNSGKFSVYGDRQGSLFVEKYLRDHPSAKLTTVGNESELPRLLRERLESASHGVETNWWEFPFFCQIDPTALKRNILRIMLPYDRGVKGARHSVLELSLNGLVRGAHQKQFEPIIRFKDKATGNDLTIDLRGLFAVDLAHQYYSSDVVNLVYPETKGNFLEQRQYKPYVIFRPHDKVRETSFECVLTQKPFESYYDATRPALSCKDSETIENPFGADLEKFFSILNHEIRE